MLCYVTLIDRCGYFLVYIVYNFFLSLSLYTYLTVYTVYIYTVYGGDSSDSSWVEQLVKGRSSLQVL